MIDQLINLHPLLFHSIIALVSLIIVAKSADLVVYGISDYAKKIGISDYLIGFLVVSVGTAMPELVAAVTATLVNQGSIAIGTVLGSNLFKIPLLGLILLITKNIKTSQNIGGNAPIITLFVIMLPVFLVTDGVLSRIDGAILLLAFFIYIARLWKREGELGEMKKKIPISAIWKDGLIFSLSMAALLLSARWLVFSSLQVSQMLKISPYWIGLIVIGIGASAPELTVQLKSIFKHHHSLAFGNVLGSLVANSALVLGIAALIRPIAIDPGTVLITSVFMFFGILCSLVLMGKEKLNWRHGVFLIGIYILFLIVELL